MKKVIKNKLYDTDTAKLLGEYQNMDDVRNLSYIREVLYQKKTGEYFLYGEGGANTRYAETISANNWKGGEKILPMDYVSAEKWAEEHLSADDFQNVFGTIADDGEKKMVSFSINAAKWEQAKRAAAYNGMSIGEYIESLIGE